MTPTRSTSPSTQQAPSASNLRSAPATPTSTTLSIDRDPYMVASWPSRVTSLVYGVLAYVGFLATFLYAIGFVSGLVVPKTVDDGAPAPLVEALLVNGGFLALFAVQHTIMARRAFKRWWTRIVPPQIERATFVLVTSAILSAMFWQWRALPGQLWSVSGAAAWFLYGVSFLGWGLVLFASFLIDHFELFGLRQVVRHFLGRAPEAPHFRERSLYRIVRHPLMFGFLLAFWSTPTMSMGHLFFAAMCTGYILVGIQIEERTLVAEHGDAYRDYQRRVPMLLPIARR
jgi:protein-S-isoprenylcysteine O-methyltransferase Ste14